MWPTPRPSSKSSRWPFKPSTNAQLVPLRQLELFREKSKLQANAEMPAAEKAERIKKIDEALDRLSL